MLSVVTSCVAVLLIISVDGVLCEEESDYTFLDQIADESRPSNRSYAISAQDDNLLNKYGDHISTNYTHLEYVNSSANTNLFDITLDNRNFFHKLNNLSSKVNATSKKKTKFVFPKLLPMPDLTGWITVIPLEPIEGRRQRHGLFRIGRYQNGQYYLNPIRKPGENVYSSGGLTPLTFPYPKKYVKKSIRSDKRILNTKIHSGFSKIDLYQDSNALPLELYSEDSIATESRHPEKIIFDTKIKHHHHHHHHKYLKTIIKKVPVRIPVKVYVDKPYKVEKRVPYPVERIVEKVVNKKVPVYLEKKVPYPVKVPQPYPVKVVEKEYISKPYPVIKNVPVYKEVKVPVYQHFHHTVEKQIPYAVKFPVEVKVPYPVEVEKKILYPVKVYVPKPYKVEKLVPQTVYKQIHVPVPVPVYIERPHTFEEHNAFQHQPYSRAGVEPEQEHTLTTEPFFYPINVYEPLDHNENLTENSLQSPTTLSNNNTI